MEREKTKRKRWIITADKFITPEQVQSLASYLQDQRDLAIARQNPQPIKDYYILQTLLESGLRLFELCNLELSDFHGKKLNVRNGKGGKPRTILLTKGTANRIKEWLTVRANLGFSLEASAPLFPSRYGEKYTVRGIQKRIELIFDAVGIDKSGHSTRHTYCSNLLETCKVGLPTVKENMGHGSIATTNLYSHAIGKLEDVELYSSSRFFKKDELRARLEPRKRNDFAKAFLRNTNLKRPEPQVGT